MMLVTSDMYDVRHFEHHQPLRPAPRCFRNNLDHNFASENQQYTQSLKSIPLKNVDTLHFVMRLLIRPIAIGSGVKVQLSGG